MNDQQACPACGSRPLLVTLDAVFVVGSNGEALPFGTPQIQAGAPMVCNAHGCGWAGNLRDIGPEDRP